MEIGHFPTPLPDELFYSLGARYSKRVKYPNEKALLYDLLGAKTATAIIDFPNHPGYVAGRFPNGVSLTADSLIDQCTLLPFFSSFLPLSRVEKIRADMKGSPGPAVYLCSGIMACRIPLPKCLRFCPRCIKEDEEWYGEAYWHRLHQLPGVLTCPIHHMFLSDSAVHRSVARKHLRFIPIECAISNLTVRPLDQTKADHKILLKIACDTSWLLKHPTAGSDLRVLHNRYLRLLIDRGLATYTGKIHAEKLLSEFTKYYSPYLRKILHCELSDKHQAKTNWLFRLVRPPNYTQHPLYHLLLIQFLSYTAEEFFQLPTKHSFFGEGPWPCLNPAANHYKKPVIAELQSGKRLRNNKPIGIFSCKCGFAYARHGPDSTPGDKFRIGRMISFGPIWEAKLKEFWKDSSLSLSEVGRRLGVDTLTVRRHAARLKLSFLRSGRSSKPLNRATQLKGKHTSTVWEKKLHSYRAKWLSQIKRNRKVTLKALRQKLPQVYSWLRQNDFEWLKGHRPSSQRRIQSTSSVDWKRRDAKYAVAVKDAALCIKNTPGRPVQLTKTAIGRAIGAVTLLQRKIHKMPLTAQALADVVETHEEYAVRRVWWTAVLYFQEYVLPREWQLIQRANVYSLKSAPQVRNALEAAMSMIKSKLSQWHISQAVS